MILFSKNSEFKILNYLKLGNFYQLLSYVKILELCMLMIIKM